jgi:copper homeostasis protein
VHSAVVAERAGAGRVELCAALADGGTTPSAGMLRAVKASVRIPVVAIVRPRGGDFVYSDDELEAMTHDIEILRSLGADGFATGVLTRENGVDVESMRLLLQCAGGAPVTFHRAFDLVDDQLSALEQLRAIGVARILTSGGAQRALDGAERLAALVRASHGVPVVMAGGGVRANNVAQLVRSSSVGEVHVRPTLLAGAVTKTAIRIRKELPDDEGRWEEIDEDHVASVVKALVDCAGPLE